MAAIVATGLTGGDFAVARFEPGGDLDPTFSGDGMVTTDFGVLVFGRPALELARDLAIQADGRIVVVGTIELDRDADVAMARYLDDGTLDGTFGAGGLFTVDFFGSFDAANDVAIQADGKIVAAGSAVNGFRENYAARAGEPVTPPAGSPGPAGAPSAHLSTRVLGREPNRSSQ